MKGVKPDAVLLMDVSVETSMQRRSNPDGDPFDKEDKNYFNKIISGYRKMAKAKWGGLKWYRIDSEPKVEVVAENVRVVLEKIFNKKL